jgi:hypothetical protein
VCRALPGEVQADGQGGSLRSFEGRRCDDQVLGVERHGLDVVGRHDHVDHHLAVKRVVLQAQRESEMVCVRLHLWREHHTTGVRRRLDVRGAALPTAAAQHGKTADGCIHFEVDESHRLRRRREYLARLAVLRFCHRSRCVSSRVCMGFCCWVFRFRRDPHLLRPAHGSHDSLVQNTSRGSSVPGF